MMFQTYKFYSLLKICSENIVLMSCIKPTQARSYTLSNVYC